MKGIFDGGGSGNGIGLGLKGTIVRCGEQLLLCMGEIDSLTSGETVVAGGNGGGTFL